MKIFQFSVVFLLGFSCHYGKQRTDKKDENFELKKEEFVVKIDRDTIFYAEGGTEILLSRNFILSNDVQSVELVEAVDIQTMLLSNLNTVTDDELLESDGMINIKMKNSNGEFIDSIKSTETYELRFKKKNSQKGFKLFEFDEKSELWTESSYPDPEVIKLVTSSQNEVKIRYRYPEYHRFLTKSLGWLNVDKYTSLSRDLVLDIDISNCSNLANYSLILADMNCIIPGHVDENGSLKFSGVPSSRDIIILGYLIEGKDFKYSLVKNNSDKNQIRLDKFRTIPLTTAFEVLEDGLPTSPHSVKKR